MSNNDDKIQSFMRSPPDGVTSFGDRDLGYGLSAGRTASVQPPLSKTAAAETTAAAVAISSWSRRTGSLAIEATGSGPCVPDASEPCDVRCGVAVRWTLKTRLTVNDSLHATGQDPGCCALAQDISGVS